VLVVAFYVAVAAACALAIKNALEPAGVGAILPAFASLDPGALAVSCLTTVGAFLALVAIERLSLSEQTRGQGPDLLLAPFVATTLSLGAGFGVLSGSALRIRLYAPFGIGPAISVYLATITTIVLLLGGVVVALLGAAVGALRLDPSIGEMTAYSQPVAIGGLLVIGGFIASAGARGRSFRLFKRTFALPSSRALLIRIALGGFNWICSAVGLYILLPEVARSSLPEFITTISALKLVALMSGAPGGLGVFEALVLALAGGDVAPAQLTAGLIASRITSFVLPVALAAIGAAFLEMRRSALQRAADRADVRPDEPSG
jgi:phosphatidylglycerol lysyltransferase